MTDAIGETPKTAKGTGTPPERPAKGSAGKIAGDMTDGEKEQDTWLSISGMNINHISDKAGYVIFESDRNCPGDVAVLKIGTRAFAISASMSGGVPFLQVEEILRSLRNR